jgi:urease accessory protein
LAFASAIALHAQPAAAHAGTGLAGGVAQGFAHPFGGLDHLLAMVSVGLWGAFLGRPLIGALPVVFPVVMVAGAALGMFGAPLPRVEIAHRRGVRAVSRLRARARAAVGGGSDRL